MTMFLSYLVLLLVATLHHLYVVSAQPPCDESHILHCKNRDKPERFFDISDDPALNNTVAAWNAVCKDYKGLKGESVHLVIKTKDGSDFYMCLMCINTIGADKVEIIRNLVINESVSEEISISNIGGNVVCFKTSTPEFVSSVEITLSSRRKKIKASELEIAGCNENSGGQTCFCPCPTLRYTSNDGFITWKSEKTGVNLKNELMDLKTESKIRDSSAKFYESCDAILSGSSGSIPSGIYRIQLPNSDPTDVYCDMTTDGIVYESCAAILNASSGFIPSGRYKIQMPNGELCDVYCDMETDGGGWMVFQRRQDGSVNFLRTWEDYKNGFGPVEGEFWLGNEKLSIITNEGLYELRVDLEDFDGNKTYAKYSSFKVGSTPYRLTLGMYSGDNISGDSLTFHHNRPFVTIDRDNSHKCADKFNGGWWYNSCHKSNLNGLYLSGSTTLFARGVVWASFRGMYYSLKFTEMKIRRIG